MTTFAFKRADRLNDVLRESLSSLLYNEVKDPRVQGVTLTRVEVTEDLANAKVFFRCLQTAPVTQARQEELHRGLEHANGFLRAKLRKSLYLKKVPQLHFVFDESLEDRARIDSLLHQVADQLKNSEENV